MTLGAFSRIPCNDGFLVFPFIWGVGWGALTGAPCVLCGSDSGRFLPPCRVEAMPPPGKVPRKELELQCEWGDCSFVCWAVEEFIEHVQQHLQQHLRSSSREDEDDDDLLGEVLAAAAGEATAGAGNQQALVGGPNHAVLIKPL